MYETVTKENWFDGDIVMEPLFMLLTKDNIILHRDLHMTDVVISFKRSAALFVDLGIYYFDEPTNERYSFFKIVYNNP